ncbi:hypothetical protein C2845_PM07G09510 [Panicum miliaceum]|uniref:Uncharacterized protein n=1 Tax=Panicum miliaceum TaxID=4540 RepID=A0A3L6SJI1_PANMI|nr:hypothetical protein C2845_PM07G09510 [Panicum miliaceum]
MFWPCRTPASVSPCRARAAALLRAFFVALESPVRCAPASPAAWPIGAAAHAVGRSQPSNPRPTARIRSTPSQP